MRKARREGLPHPRVGKARREAGPALECISLLLSFLCLSSHYFPFFFLPFLSADWLE